MPKVKSFYQHYKGGLYYVEGIATHSETQKELVVYRDVTGELWVRPLEMWSEEVNGKLRFEYLYDQIEASLLFDKELNINKHN
ncbi:MAG: DUF1653 domain-containing protein [Kurthia sp.]